MSAAFDTAVADEVAATVARIAPAPAVCVVRDGRFVTPCAAVRRAAVLVHEVDPRTSQPTRSHVGLWVEGAFTPFRSCPFCGVELGGRS